MHESATTPKKTAYFFRNDNGSIAFVDHGKKLTTARSDKEVIESMIALGKAKGWRHLTVEGSPAFRAAVGQEAGRYGVAVVGYTPETNTGVPEVKLAARVRKPSALSALSDREQIAITTLERLLQERGDSPAEVRAVVSAARQRVGTRNAESDARTSAQMLQRDQQVRRQPRIEVYDRAASKPTMFVPAPSSRQKPQHRSRA